MSDLKEKAKKYWPWLVGGGIGIFLLVRMNSGSSGGGSDYASVMAAQAQASAQNAAAGLAQQNADRQYGLAVKTLDNQQTLGMATLAAQVEGVRGQLAAQMAGVEAGKLVSLTEIARAAQADKLTFEMGLTNIAAQREVSLFNSAVQGQVAYTTAQGAAGKEIALGTAAMIAQLQAPTVQAIQWEAQKDIAAFQSAASVAAAGYGAQAAEATAMGAATTAVLASLAAQANAQSNAVSTMFAGIAMQEASNVPSGLAEAVASKNEGRSSTATALGTAAIAAFSDVAVKENIGEASDSALEKIEKISFVSFDYLPEVAASQETPHYNIGVIAQQLRQIDPTLVREENGILMLNPTPLLMLALKGIQELKEAKNG